MDLRPTDLPVLWSLNNNTVEEELIWNLFFLLVFWGEEYAIQNLRAAQNISLFKEEQSTSKQSWDMFLLADFDQSYSSILAI